MNESSLEDHRRNRKILNPPFLHYLPDMKTSSWFNERLPEMIWAVLVMGNLNREDALDFFRYVITFVDANRECSDITMTGISKLSDSKRESFIKYLTSYSEEVNNILNVLLLFPELPSLKEWKNNLKESVDLNDDWNKLMDGVEKSFWHQSEAATDCRWISFLCKIISGEIKFSSSIPDIEETLKGVYEYPNYGDIKHVNGFIRASEISFVSGKKDSEWSKYFWKYCFDNTGCLPEEAVSEKIKNRREELSKEIEIARKSHINETIELRNDLIDHFFKTSGTSSIDSRHEGVFGITLYALSLYIETIFYGTSLSITGRLGLRSLVETYITFAYLLQKESLEPRVWDDYRSYGIGQIKLVYLKLKKMKKEPVSFTLDEMRFIVNEDKWMEFISINLGHWDSANLRQMSEDVGLKDLYDKYYGYTSNFMHANWGAVRESVYQKCLNPLHRYHRVPVYDLPLMSSTIDDAKEIMNNILECLSLAYPKFENKLKNKPKFKPMNIKLDFTSFIDQPHNKQWFQKIAEQTLQEINTEKLKNKEIEISVAVVDNEEIKKLNNNLREKDAVTDVLSIGDYSDEKNIFTEKENNIFLGEIILCYEFIEKSAKINGKTVEHELSYVFSHGILHLLGYKHSDEMYAIQEKISDNISIDV